MIKTIFFLMLAFSLSAPLHAQQKNQLQQGIQLDQGKPINIESDALEVNDKANSAHFTGNVIAIQGETILKCDQMTVIYTGSQMRGAAPVPAAPAAKEADKSQGRQIKRLEAKGNVRFASRDQTATGQNGVYDPEKNTILMTGKVTLTQGPNVVTGERLVIDTLSGKARVETDKKGRVRALFIPGSEPEQANKR